uniref:Ras-related protein Rab-18 n=1 Tax=Lygus hesperus TaxID=30085 RepID=A0A0A9Z7G8_LYGHE
MTRITIDNETYTIALWDTAGQERYRTLASMYYRGANGFVLVYDVTRMETFTNLQYWIDEIQLYCPIDEYYIILVGNQIDKKDRQVPYTMGEEFARSNHMLFIEASAKSAEGIAQTFTELVTKIVELRQQRSANDVSSTTNTVALTDVASPNDSLPVSIHRLCCQS